MIAKIDLTKLGRNCAVAITENGATNVLTYVEDSSNIEINYNQNDNTVTVTIAGTTSATTKNITTGSFFTMDSGSGAVTITSYATFKTNYALLFLNGGSAPTPTLEQVLTAGQTSSININITDAISLSTSLNQNGLFTQNITNGYIYNTQYLFNGIDFNVSNEYFSKLLIKNYNNISNNITNYLPETSGTLLNGTFNIESKGLFIDYSTNRYNLGDDNTGSGLYIDNENLLYSIGLQGEKCLSINNNLEQFYLGNGSLDGLFIDTVNRIYTLGYMSGDTNLTLNSGNNETTLKTKKIILTGTNLQSNIASSGNSGEHLVITLNGTQYKIKLENL